jgi:molecular chaperone GrpE
LDVRLEDQAPLDTIRRDEIDEVVSEVEEHSTSRLEEQEKETEEELQDIEQLRQQVAHFKGQVEQTHEQYLRSLADLENFRRRARKEKEDAIKYATLPLIESLLPVVDNFERALATDYEEDKVDVLKEGVEMVYRQLVTALSQAGVTLIESRGKPFDPHEHHAVMQVESDASDSGMVVEELQIGYRLYDRVIRPSMVKISS